MARKLDILVVDDLEANRSLICRFVSKLGHAPAAAVNGLEAVEYCHRKLPDLILMDIMMPVMDGYAATAEIRRLCGERWLPVIFLSAKAGEADQLEGLNTGADDYLPKPVNLAMLEAKIRVMMRIAEMQQRIADNTERLDAYRQDNERDQTLARNIMARILGHGDERSGPVKRWTKPARNLSGDVIAHGHSPSGALHLLLADCTGHGLSAAIGAVPAVDAFLTMTRRGFAIGAIAREINAKLHRLLPVGHFVSAALVCVNGYHQRIDVWNGGIPCLLFADGNGKILRRWPSAQPPLGILPDVDFEARVETTRLESAGELFICSDGLTEVENEAGEQFGSERLAAVIERARGRRSFASVVAAVERHLGQQEARDDISLAVVACAPGVFNPVAGDFHERPIESRPYQASGWSIALRFDSTELKSQDCLPQLVSWLNQLSLDEARFAELLLIVTELFNNALDHGVLGLDSALKQSTHGFEAYLQQREASLKKLQQGYIEVGLQRLVANGQPLLCLRVRDSGAGFDHQRVLDRIGREDSLAPHGRGLLLVRALCPNLSYRHGGSEAHVEYALRGYQR